MPTDAHTRFSEAAVENLVPHDARVRGRIRATLRPEDLLEDHGPPAPGTVRVAELASGATCVGR